MFNYISIKNFIHNTNIDILNLKNRLSNDGLLCFTETAQSLNHEKNQKISHNKIAFSST